jgi:hypothetical protein
VIGAALEQRQLLRLTAMTMALPVLLELQMLTLLGAPLVMRAMLVQPALQMLLVRRVRTAPLVLPEPLVLPTRLTRLILLVSPVRQYLRVLLGLRRGTKRSNSSNRMGSSSGSQMVARRPYVTLGQEGHACSSRCTGQCRVTA